MQPFAPHKCIGAPNLCSIKPCPTLAGLYFSSWHFFLLHDFVPFFYRHNVRTCMHTRKKKHSAWNTSEMESMNTKKKKTRSWTKKRMPNPLWSVSKRSKYANIDYISWIISDIGRQSVFGTQLDEHKIWWALASKTSYSMQWYFFFSRGRETLPRYL